MITQLNQTLIYRRTICSIVESHPKKVVISRWNGGKRIEVKVKDIIFDANCHVWRATTGKHID